MRSLMMRAWIEVDLGAVVRNAVTLAQRAGVPLLPMIKADAYGLGAVPVARALEQVSPWGYGVATIEEGEELRGAGISREILICAPLLLGELSAVAEARLTPILSSAEQIARWSTTRRPWHLGVDTGMSRNGVRWHEVGRLHDLIRAHPPDGACTHFFAADLDTGARALQERRFSEAMEALPVAPRVLHAENSAAVEGAAPSRWSFVRPGIFLYGVQSRADSPIAPEPVVAVRSRVVQLRTIAAGDTVSYHATWRATGARRIATLPLGYADGYRRGLSNRGVALIRGQPAPVVGLVTMDMTMVDVTDVPCEEGDIATLVGSDGGGQLDVAQVAAAGDVSPYELLTGLRLRLPRQYRGAVGIGP